MSRTSAGSIHLPYRSAGSLEEKARALPNFDLDYGFADVVQKLHDRGLIPYAAESELPEQQRQELRKVVDFYRLQHELLCAQRRAMSRRIVEEKTRSGDYGEFDLQAGSEEIRAHFRDVPPGLEFQELDAETNKRRVFILSSIDHPEITEAFIREDNARAHFARDVAQLAERWEGDRDTTGDE